MPQRLVVVAGGYQSGKMPLTRKLMAEDASLVLVHRDTLRDSLVTPVDEWVITQIMGDIGCRLLATRHSVICCAWNLEPDDRAMWDALSTAFRVPLEWLDVRRPEVAAMIPPMENVA